MNQNAQTEHELTVPLRPNTNAVGAALVSASIACGLFLVAPTVSVPPQSVTPAWSWSWLAVTAALAAMIPALSCLFYRAHARLVLNETGLRWRTWSDWRRVSWHAVEDYYDLPPHPSDGTGELMTLKTTAGAILLDRRWQESADVRQWVQARATAAEATEWGVIGQRTTKSDTRTFSYPQEEFWSLIGGFGVFVPLILLNWYWLLHPKGRTFWAMLTQNWKPGHLWDSLIGTGFTMLFFFVYIVIFNYPLRILLANVPMLLDRRRRRWERITIRQSGITFEAGRRQFSADWDEVTGYFFQPSSASQSRFFRAAALSSSLREMWRWTYVVETRQGAFEYSGMLGGYVQLGEILKQHGLILQTRGFTGAEVER